MDTFGPALNGFYDPADQLSRYLRGRAAEEFAAERDEKRAIASRSDFEARRERVREQFLDAVGGLPERPDDLAVEVTGVTERRGHTVERIVFRSRPQFHVTANCYVPDGEGPHPGVLFLCGHVDDPKPDPSNQRACIELALNGFVVLVVDPIGQGEREQYRDPETGEAIVSGGGGVFAHCYAGQQCFYAGANLARYFVHDARCALDYLHDRPDVHEDRLGVTGTSGGGIQTTYLMVADDRIDAAAPCCAITEREEWLQTGKRIDAEQVLTGAVPNGINYDDLLTAMAPRPVCVGAAASDEYFPIEGVYESIERARRVYELYDAVDRLELVVADEPHCSVYEIGDGIFEWLCDQLGDGEYEPHDDLSVLDEADLRCTPNGSVCEAYPDERTIDDLIRAYVARTRPEAGPESSASTDSEGDGRGAAADRVRDAVTEAFDLDREDCELHPRYVSESESDGLEVRHVFFKTERDPDAVVAGVLVSDAGGGARTSDGDSAGDRTPAVVLYEGGTERLPERREDIESLAADRGSVLVFDPRGVGAVRNREIPIPAWAEGYYGMYGTEFKLAYDALLLDSSLFAVRVYDALRAAEFLRDATDAERVAFVGDGVGAYHALYAAVAGDCVEAVDLRDLGPSFRELATAREYPYDPRLTVTDVLGDCDVPRLLAALEDRNVRVERTDN
ncbi:hypothetical protein BRC82_10170 [Halobacteriales archaeon QS_1_67_19]|nr:MAG: hypothetical protein BRC82_10170 [Halobacteriales archaeon QS_1_67_19]